MKQRRRFNDRERFALSLASSGVCARCGMPLEQGWHADHIVPYSLGGLTDVANGQALCPVCNLTKGASMTARMNLRLWQKYAIAAYRAKDAENFLAVATPGAGKTTFALTIAQEELEFHRVAQIVVVVPTDHLRTQWRNAAHSNFGIQLDGGFDNRMGWIAKDYDGVVVTYQQVAANVAVFRRLSSERPTLVVFDEIHHAGDRAGWGEAIRSSFCYATRRLAITGTAFRSDNQQIPFIDYGSDGKSRSDYSYGYEDAMREGVCREVYFHTFEGSFEWWNNVNGSQQATFADELTERQSSERLRTALSTEADWLPQVIRDADAHLLSVREHDFADAAGLVIAMNRAHALKIAELIKKQIGEEPMVAISDNPDDPEPSKTIARFAAGDADVTGNPYCKIPRWLVAVKMVSEGVDIPRLCVGVYATNVLSELFFRQAVGRFVRVMDEAPGLAARIFLPKEKTLVAHVEKITEERQHAITEMDAEEAADERGQEVSGQRRPSLFEPVQAEAHADTVYIGDESFDQHEVAEIRKFMLASGMEGMALEFGLKFYRKAQQWFIYTHGGQIATTPVDQVIEQVTRPLEEEKKAARAQATRLVNRLASASDIEHRHINAALNHAAGISKVNYATLEQLNERIDLLRDWLQLATASPETSRDGWAEVMRRGR